MNISLLVGLKNNLDYSKHFYKTTRDLYPDVEICFVSYGSTDGTHEWLDELKNTDSKVKCWWTKDNGNLSETYNKAAELSTKEYITYVHNDIVLAPGFLENLQKCAHPNSIVAYTTVEPPIFADYERDGKLIQDFGTDLSTFKLHDFYKYVSQKQQDYAGKVVQGVSFFMCMHRQLYLDIGGMDETTFNPPQMWVADIDLCLRYKLLNTSLILSLDAIAYHFVSKSSRATKDHHEVEIKSIRNFIRKWGCLPQPVESLEPTKYNIGFIINNCTQQLLEILEPWCNNIYVDCNTNSYIDKEQPNTKFNLKNRIKPIINSSVVNDIIVEFDNTRLTNDNFKLLQQLPEIIKQSGDIGKFELDIYNITINNLNIKNFTHYKK